MKLIEDWRKSWKLLSVQFALAAAALPELLYRIALAVGDVLPALSHTVVEHLPPWLRATLAIGGALATFLRLVQQPVKGKDDGRSPD